MTRRKLLQWTTPATLIDWGTHPKPPSASIYTVTNPVNNNLNFKPQSFIRIILLLYAAYRSCLSESSVRKETQ